MNLRAFCFLLSLCYAGSAAAIGLGDISVRSYLGQPLHATVTLLGATPKTAADCFSLDASAGSIAPPLNAQFSIEQSGGLTLLHIRTPRPVNDPVVQFVLAADCEARLQRDYVVLLDPPVVVEPASVADRQATANSVEPPGAGSTDSPGAASVPRVARRATRVDPAASPAIARPHAAPRRPAAPAKRQIAAVSKPRLILSGKHQTQPDKSLPLQPVADLPVQPLAQSGNPTAAELSDDNTALSRKIAHLEMQLAMLQKRNAELDARRRAALTRVAPPRPDKPAQWPLYLLAIGLLSGGGALTLWLGRRRNRRVPEDLSWVQADSLPALSKAAQTPEAEPAPAPAQLSAIVPPAMDQSTQVSDDIVDQAEVYLAHGHDELAVHLLQEHLRETPTESPVPWLLLLDLLHRAGDTPAYAAARAECSRYFNINLSSHPFSQDIDTGKGLEAYPHLLEQLTLKWRSPEIGDFFDDLIFDHRAGTRLGFDPGAYRDILLLRSIAQDILPLAA